MEDTNEQERLCWALRPLVRMVPAGAGECWVRFKVGAQEFTIGNQPLAEDEAAHFAGLFVFALAGAFRTLPAGGAVDAPYPNRTGRRESDLAYAPYIMGAAGEDSTPKPPLTSAKARKD